MTPERKRRTARYDAAEGEAAETAAPLPHNAVATNTGVRLACTMAAMIGLFALFLCWQERESRVIRRFAVQSAALTAIHALCAACALTLGFAVGGVPYLGLIVTLMCWLFYIAVLVLLVFGRIRLMEKAWQGVRFDYPAPVERLLARFY